MGKATYMYRLNLYCGNTPCGNYFHHQSPIQTKYKSTKNTKNTKDQEFCFCGGLQKKVNLNDSGKSHFKVFLEIFAQERSKCLL